MVPLVVQRGAAQRENGGRAIDQRAIGQVFDERFVSRLFDQVGDAIHGAIEVPDLPRRRPGGAVQDLCVAIGVVV